MNAPWQVLDEHAVASFHLGKYDEARKYFRRVAGFELPASARELNEKNMKLLLGTIVPNEARPLILT